MKKNGLGLPAREVYESAPYALCAPHLMNFDGATVTVEGGHLPPNGDPGALKAIFEQGVRGSLEYPLPFSDWEERYWYWPNAGQAAFRVSIDLAASAPGSDPFTFRLACPEGRETKIYIPQQLSDSVGYPTDISQLTRVQSFDNSRTALFTGYNHYRTVSAILQDFGVANGPGKAILDWGCGHGRITRHFLRDWADSHIAGVDIDAQNIAWCQERFNAENFIVGPLHPPVPLESGQFNAVFAVSVMTHLTEPVQKEWLRELSRLLRPGGIAVLTFHGPAAVAFASIDRDPQWWAQWKGTGFDDGALDLAISTAEANYYRNTYQTAEHVRRSWTDSFELLEIRPAVFGFQDVAILRKAR